MDERTDEVLAHLVQQGDVDLFGVLMERYEAKLTRYLTKFLIRGEDAKDILQEIFIKAYVNINTFDPKRPFSPWIYRIAHNEAVNTIRKRKRDMIIPLDLDLLFPQPVAKETADKETQDKELAQLIEKGLDKLDSKYREALVLYFFEEMDYKMIAEVLKIPTSTVGVRIKRAKEMLKKQLPNI